MNVYRCERCGGFFRTETGPEPCPYCGPALSDPPLNPPLNLGRLYSSPPLNQGRLYAAFRSGPLPPGMLWGAADDGRYRLPRAPWVLTPADVIILRIEGIDPEVDAC